MREVPNVVVIGYGLAGKFFHAYLIDLVPGLNLYGVQSRNPETRAKIVADRPRVRAIATYEEVLADPDVDLVVLATPSSTHAPMTIAALEAGKNVVTDKVMCLNLAECDSMIEAAQKTGKLLTVFQNRRWDGDFLTVRKAMHDGTLGTVRWIEMGWMGFGGWGGWRGQKEMGGGRFYDLGAHLIDQACQFFPSPLESVYCRMRHDFDDRDIESEALLVITFAGGETAICDLSSRAAISKPRFYAKGDKGTLIKYGLDPQEDAMKARDIDSAVESPENYARVKPGKEPEFALPTLPGRWRSYYENVADALTGKAELAVTADSVRRQIAVLDAAQESAATGEAVRL